MKNAIEYFYLHNWLAIITDILPKYANEGNYIRVEGVKELTDLAKPIPKTKKTDMSFFKENFGFDLPKDIDDFINNYWHINISGKYKYPNDIILAEDRILLFRVMRFKGEKELDFLYDPTIGFMSFAEEWRGDGGDITKYIPIGFMDVTGYFILYEVQTGKIFLQNIEIDGRAEDKPIADSFPEFIKNIEVSGSYEIASVAVKDTNTGQYLCKIAEVDLNAMDNE